MTIAPPVRRWSAAPRVKPAGGSEAGEKPVGQGAVFKQLARHLANRVGERGAKTHLCDDVAVEIDAGGDLFAADDLVLAVGAQAAWCFVVE